MRPRLLPVAHSIDACQRTAVAGGNRVAGHIVLSGTAPKRSRATASPCSWRLLRLASVAAASGFEQREQSPSHRRQRSRETTTHLVGVTGRPSRMALSPPVQLSQREGTTDVGRGDDRAGSSGPIHRVSHWRSSSSLPCPARLADEVQAHRVVTKQPERVDEIRSPSVRRNVRRMSADR